METDKRVRRHNAGRWGHITIAVLTKSERCVKQDGSGFQPRQAQAVWCGLARIDREMPFGPTAHFRLLVRRGMLEFYLDDVLFHIRSLSKPATGKIGIVGTPGSITGLKAWQMSL